MHTRQRSPSLLYNIRGELEKSKSSFLGSCRSRKYTVCLPRVLSCGSDDRNLHGQMSSPIPAQLRHHFPGAVFTCCYGRDKWSFNCPKLSAFFQCTGYVSKNTAHTCQSRWIHVYFKTVRRPQKRMPDPISSCYSVFTGR